MYKINSNVIILDLKYGYFDGTLHSHFLYQSTSANYSLLLKISNTNFWTFHDIWWQCWDMQKKSCEQPTRTTAESTTIARKNDNPRLELIERETVVDSKRGL